jgi:hypothetical protein
MENPYISGGIGAGITAIVAVIVRMNHKRLRSSCCGRKLDLSVDIEDTTPPNIKIPKPIEIVVDTK